MATTPPFSDEPFSDEPFSDQPLSDEPLSNAPPSAPAWGEASSLAREPSAPSLPRLNHAELSPTTAAPFADSGGDLSSLDMLLDISLQVSVELGRTKMSIGDVLALRFNSVIELDKLAGEPADIFVSGTRVARGEVVVVDEKFGVRVLDVVSKAKRLAMVE